MDLLSEVLVTDKADLFETSPTKKVENMRSGEETIEIDKVTTEGHSRMENEMKELRSEVKELTGHMKQVLVVLERFGELTVRVDKNEKSVKRVQEDVKKIDGKVKDGIAEVADVKDSHDKLIKRVKALEEK